MFCHLGDVLCIEDGVQDGVTIRIRFEWKRFKDVADVLCKKGLWIKLRGLVYKMYIKNALVMLQNAGTRYKEIGVHSNKNASNDMWQDTEG